MAYLALCLITNPDTPEKGDLKMLVSPCPNPVQHELQLNPSLKNREKEKNQRLAFYIKTAILARWKLQWVMRLDGDSVCMGK